MNPFQMALRASFWVDIGAIFRAKKSYLIANQTSQLAKTTSASAKTTSTTAGIPDALQTSSHSVANAAAVYMQYSYSGLSLQRDKKIPQ